MEKADSIIERYLSLTILFENAAPPLGDVGSMSGLPPKAAV